MTSLALSCGVRPEPLRGEKMPAINFQERFADAVETHEKRQTFRPKRKHPIKQGDVLYLYTGMRTKQCRKLRTTVCIDTVPGTINEHSMSLLTDGGTLEVWPEGTPLNWFAWKDGFNKWTEMRDWFKKRYGLPFEGVLISW